MPQYEYEFVTMITIDGNPKFNYHKEIKELAEKGFRFVGMRQAADGVRVDNGSYTLYPMAIMERMVSSLGPQKSLALQEPDEESTPASTPSGSKAAYEF